MKNRLLIIFIFVVSGLLGFVLSLIQHAKRAEPIPTIETFHYPTLFVTQLKNDKDAGRKIFNEFCSTCHGVEPQIDINAPRINDRRFWDTHKKNIDQLLKFTINGGGAMPARGGCFECSDEQLRETVIYILNWNSRSGQ